MLQYDMDQDSSFLIAEILYYKGTVRGQGVEVGGKHSMVFSTRQSTREERWDHRVESRPCSRVS